jgi:hypothetical protein
LTYSKLWTRLARCPISAPGIPGRPRPRPPAIPRRCSTRAAITAASISAHVRVGIERGLKLRSCNPASPPVLNRATRRCPHWRDTSHRLGHLGDGLAFDNDALDEQSSAVDRETGVTVSHEDLRFVKTAISTMPGGLLASADRHQRHGRLHPRARDSRRSPPIPTDRRAITTVPGHYTERKEKHQSARCCRPAHVANRPRRIPNRSADSRSKWLARLRQRRPMMRRVASSTGA